jgi:hypothetical protein
MPFVAVSAMSPVQYARHVPGPDQKGHPPPTPYVDSLFFRLFEISH